MHEEVAATALNGKIKALCDTCRLSEAVSSFLHHTKPLLSDTYKCLLQCCTKSKAISEGHAVHAHIVKYHLSSKLQSTILSLYVQCEHIEDASRVFSRMIERDAFSFNIMISAYTNHGDPCEALNLFHVMWEGTSRPDDITYVNILKTCKIFGNSEMGNRVHACLVQTGSQAFISIANSLIGMYVHLGKLNDACSVFASMRTKDVVSWTSIIVGYAKHGYACRSFNFFLQMKDEGIGPDRVMLLTLLQACTSAFLVVEGKQIHADIILYGLEMEPYLASAVVDFYSKCGDVRDARRVFDSTSVQDLVLCNVMIAGHAKHGQLEEVLEIHKGLGKKSLKPDKITMLNMMDACSIVKNEEMCWCIHTHIVHDGFETERQIMNSLLDIYCKYQRFSDAFGVFNKLHERDVVSWSIMITGYAKHGHCEEVFKFLEKMKVEGVNPDRYTFVSILKACAGLEDLEQGRVIHGHAVYVGVELDSFIGSMLVYMYSNSGYLLDARHIFDSITPDIVSSTAMIVAYAKHGRSKEAIVLMENLLTNGIVVNHVTLLGVLNACSHTGLVEEAQCLFNRVKQKGVVMKTTEHYACIIDLLSRAGCLEEAESILNELPCEPTSTMWLTLLRSCAAYGNKAVAKRAAQNVLRLDPKNDAALILLSNTYVVSRDSEPESSPGVEADLLDHL